MNVNQTMTQTYFQPINQLTNWKIQFDTNPTLSVYAKSVNTRVKQLIDENNFTNARLCLK